IMARLRLAHGHRAIMGCSTVMARSDGALVAVFCDGPPGDVKSAPPQRTGQLNIRQRALPVFVFNQAAKLCLHGACRYQMSCGIRHAARKEMLERKYAVGRIDVLPANRAADRRLVHGHLISDLTEDKWTRTRAAMVEKVALQLD